MSKIFLSYCANAGIIRQYSQPYTPQHNGIAERRNSSLLDIVRSLLSDTFLPNHLWAEAVRAACIIMNLRSSKAHPDKTPDELFSGITPFVSHLRTFGALAYMHQSQPSCSKLDPCSTPHILLSFDDLFITGLDVFQISALQLILAQEFEMKDLGLMQNFLGVKIIQTSARIFLHQFVYMQQLLARHSSSTVPPSSIPILPTTRLSLDTTTPLSIPKPTKL